MATLISPPQSETQPEREPVLNLLTVQDRMDVSLWQSLRANLRDLFLPQRQAPLHLTSRPITQRDAAGNPDVVDFWTAQNSSDVSLVGSLVRNFWETLFPPKQSPLHLTSKPVRVREIWGDYNYRKEGAKASMVVHVLMVAALIGVTWAGRHLSKVEVKKPQESVALIAPDPNMYMPISNKKDDTLAGGGGGGDRDKLQAPKGKLPKFAMEQLTPPAMVIRNEHPKLTAEPTVVMPPQVKLPLAANMPNLGNPLSSLPSGPPSNGTGSGGGIGEGRGGGVGSGTGPGVGPGSGGGYGGGVFRVGGGVSAPKALFTPDPEYSEEARKAKFQGTVVLWLIVDQSGQPHQIKIARTLGMGLDQKAVEAVRQWKFEPAKKDGRPVAVQINVEVNFHLY